MVSRLVTLLSCVFMFAITCLSDAVAQDEVLFGEVKPGDRQGHVRAILQLTEAPDRLTDKAVREAIYRQLLSIEELQRTAAEIVVREHHDAFLNDLPEMLKDTTTMEYLMAVTAIRAIGEPAKTSREAVAVGLDSDEYEVVLSSLWALKAMGKESAAYMPKVIEIIEKEYPPGREFNLQLGAIQLLASLGPEAMPARECLLKAAKEGAVSVRTNAMIALASIVGDDEEVAAVFEDKLNSFFFADRQRTLEAIAEWREHGKGLQDAVRKLMLDPNKSVVPWAAFALARIGGDTTESLRVLRQCMNDPSYETDAIEIVGKLGPVAAPLVSELLLRLDSEDDGIRESAVLSLETVGKGNTDAIGRLKQIAQNDDDFLIRRFANRAVQSLSRDTANQ